MKDSLVAQILEPYAQALMSIAQNHDLIDRFGEDVSFLLSLLHESDDFRTLLASPLIKNEVKKGVLQQIVREQVHPFTLSFLMLLVDRKRITFLAGVCKQYQSLLRDLKKTSLAEVTSAIELNDAQKEVVRQRVKQMVGAEQVELETFINPDLLGGVVIKVGSQVIDASLRGQLRRIGLRLTSSV